MQLRHIYWFSYFDMQEPSVRYRASYPLEHLEKEYGITYNIAYPGRGLKNYWLFVVTFLSALLFRKNGSLIVFQKVYTKGLYATLLKLLLFLQPENTVYDIDDAEHTRRPADTIHYFMKRVSFCTIGSRALMEYAHAYNDNVLLLTSPVMAHSNVKQQREDMLTIGWVGYYGAHKESLQKLFLPALQNIDIPIKLTMLGVRNETDIAEVKSYFKHNKNISLYAPLHLDWLDEKTIYREIKKFDIGVSPLLDTEFNRAKSAFKLKQCLSCGVPVLVSRLGENKVFTKEGMNGYFCDGPAEFEKKIKEMAALTDRDFAAMSRAARKTLTEFDMHQYCDELLGYLATPVGAHTQTIATV